MGTSGDAKGVRGLCRPRSRSQCRRAKIGGALRAVRRRVGIGAAHQGAQYPARLVRRVRAIVRLAPVRCGGILIRLRSRWRNMGGAVAGIGRVRDRGRRGSRIGRVAARVGYGIVATVGLGVLPSTMFAKARPEDFSRSGEEEKSCDQGSWDP